MKRFLPRVPSVKVSECSGCISTLRDSAKKQESVQNEVDSARLRQGLLQAREDLWPKVFWPNLDCNKPHFASAPPPLPPSHYISFCSKHVKPKAEVSSSHCRGQKHWHCFAASLATFSAPVLRMPSSRFLGRSDGMLSAIWLNQSSSLATSQASGLFVCSVP